MLFVIASLLFNFLSDYCLILACMEYPVYYFFNTSLLLFNVSRCKVTVDFYLVEYGLSFIRLFYTIYQRMELIFCCYRILLFDFIGLITGFLL